MGVTNIGYTPAAQSVIENFSLLKLYQISRIPIEIRLHV